MEEVLTQDLPNLMAKFPPEMLRKEKSGTVAEVILSSDMGFADRLQNSVNAPPPTPAPASASTRAPEPAPAPAPGTH